MLTQIGLLEILLLLTLIVTVISSKNELKGSRLNHQELLCLDVNRPILIIKMSKYERADRMGSRKEL